MVIIPYKKKEVESLSSKNLTVGIDSYDLVTSVPLISSNWYAALLQVLNPICCYEVG